MDDVGDADGNVESGDEESGGEWEGGSGRKNGRSAYSYFNAQPVQIRKLTIYFEGVFLLPLSLFIPQLFMSLSLALQSSPHRQITETHA